MWRKLTLFTLALTAIGLYAGCGTRTPAPQADDAGTQPAKNAPPVAVGGEEHGHKPGAHGGNIVEIGRDNYHAEAVFEKGGTIKLFTLAKDEAKVLEVESQTLTAQVQVEGEESEPNPVLLKPVPQADDAAGKTSQFVGMLPKELRGKKLIVTVPIKIAGERFRFAIRSAAETHEVEMPPPLEEDAEKKLYLTPGGRYTQDDIKANGGVTASEKYKGKMAAHSVKPLAGDKICPITLTKANSKFTWVVGGKTYEFCCPPCIDEFVAKAKDEPESIQSPESYVKKK